MCTPLVVHSTGLDISWIRSWFQKPQSTDVCDFGVSKSQSTEKGVDPNRGTRSRSLLHVCRRR